MCLAIPGKIMEINGSAAVVEMGGVTTKADLSLIEEAKVGDYLIVHAGFAIQVMDEEEALETLSLLREFLSQEDETAPRTFAPIPSPSPRFFSDER